MIIVGLTGSIGMGKSTTAQLFRDMHIPVYSGDDAVHQLYAGQAVPLIEAAFPGTTENNVVNRAKLSVAVVGNPSALGKLESIVHPLVRAEESRFVEDARQRDEPLIVLDIPLLFETGGQARVDKVVVVTAPPEVQRARVLARPGMNAAKLDAILERQMPDAEKRAQADFIIDTSRGVEKARADVQKLVKLLRE